MKESTFFFYYINYLMNKYLYDLIILLNSLIALFKSGLVVKYPDQESPLGSSYTNKSPSNYSN